MRTCCLTRAVAALLWPRRRGRTSRWSRAPGRGRRSQWRRPRGHPHSRVGRKQASPAMCPPGCAVESCGRAAESWRGCAQAGHAHLEFWPGSALAQPSRVAARTIATIPLLIGSGRVGIASTTSFTSGDRDAQTPTTLDRSACMRASSPRLPPAGLESSCDSPRLHHSTRASASSALAHGRPSRRSQPAMP